MEITTSEIENLRDSGATEDQISRAIDLLSNLKEDAAEHGLELTKPTAVFMEFRVVHVDFFRNLKNLKFTFSEDRTYGDVYYYSFVRTLLFDPLYNNNAYKAYRWLFRNSEIAPEWDDES